mmetsp:Transcript_111428/g.347323  ORF Transcript_111428/g.347323 Transcript_111428/m.347323 type:complete len:211 (+) Transcript_111428:913-1545(+)
MSLSRAGSCCRFGLAEVRRPVEVLRLKEEWSRPRSETSGGSFVRNTVSAFWMEHTWMRWARPMQPASPSLSLAEPNLPFAGSLPARASSSEEPTPGCPPFVLLIFELSSPRPPIQTLEDWRAPSPNSRCRICIGLPRLSLATPFCRSGKCSSCEYRFSYSRRTQSRKACSSTTKSFSALMVCNAMRSLSSGTPRPSMVASASPRGHQKRR